MEQIFDDDSNSNTFCIETWYFIFEKLAFYLDLSVASKLTRVCRVWRDVIVKNRMFSIIDYTSMDSQSILENNTPAFLSTTWDHSLSSLYTNHTNLPLTQLLDNTEYNMSLNLHGFAVQLHKYNWNIIVRDFCNVLGSNWYEKCCPQLEYIQIVNVPLGNNPMMMNYFWMFILRQVSLRKLVLNHVRMTNSDMEKLIIIPQSFQPTIKIDNDYFPVDLLQKNSSQFKQPLCKLQDNNIIDHNIILSNTLQSMDDHVQNNQHSPSSVSRSLPLSYHTSCRGNDGDGQIKCSSASVYLNPMGDDKVNTHASTSTTCFEDSDNRVDYFFDNHALELMQRDACNPNLEQVDLSYNSLSNAHTCVQWLLNKKKLSHICLHGNTWLTIKPFIHLRDKLPCLRNMSLSSPPGCVQHDNHELFDKIRDFDILYIPNTPIPFYMYSNTFLGNNRIQCSTMSPDNTLIQADLYNQCIYDYIQSFSTIKSPLHKHDYNTHDDLALLSLPACTQHYTPWCQHPPLNIKHLSLRDCHDNIFDSYLYKQWQSSFSEHLKRKIAQNYTERQMNALFKSYYQKDVSWTCFASVKHLDLLSCCFKEHYNHPMFHLASFTSLKSLKLINTRMRCVKNLRHVGSTLETLELTLKPEQIPSFCNIIHFLTHLHTLIITIKSLDRLDSDVLNIHLVKLCTSITKLKQLKHLSYIQQFDDTIVKINFPIWLCFVKYAKTLQTLLVDTPQDSCFDLNMPLMDCEAYIKIPSDDTSCSLQTMSINVKMWTMTDWKLWRQHTYLLTPTLQSLAFKEPDLDLDLYFGDYFDIDLDLYEWRNLKSLVFGGNMMHQNLLTRLAQKLEQNTNVTFKLQTLIIKSWNIKTLKKYDHLCTWLKHCPDMRTLSLQTMEHENHSLFKHIKSTLLTLRNLQILCVKQAGFSDVSHFRDFVEQFPHLNTIQVTHISKQHWKQINICQIIDQIQKKNASFENIVVDHHHSIIHYHKTM